MLQITPHHHLLLAVKPVDFRKGIDSLAALCRQTLQQDPFRGTFFIFTNKLRTTVKILVYDGKCIIRSKSNADSGANRMVNPV